MVLAWMAVVRGYSVGASVWMAAVGAIIGVFVRRWVVRLTPLDVSHADDRTRVDRGVVFTAVGTGLLFALFVWAMIVWECQTIDEVRPNGIWRM